MPSSSTAASSPGRNARMPSASIAIDIGSMVARPMREARAGLAQEAAARQAVAPVLAAAQAEPAEREQRFRASSRSCQNRLTTRWKGHSGTSACANSHTGQASRAASSRRAEDRGEESGRGRASTIPGDASEHAAGRFDRRLDLRIAMRGGDEARLVRRGREIDAGIEHAVEEAPEAARRRRPSPAGSSTTARSVREEEPEHAADVVGRERDARRARSACDARRRAGRSRRRGARGNPGVAIASSVARPAAIATGLPDSVPAW